MRKSIPTLRTINRSPPQGWDFFMMQMSPTCISMYPPEAGREHYPHGGIMAVYYNTIDFPKTQLFASMAAALLPACMLIAYDKRIASAQSFF
jgi:hypothetical protein